MNETNAQQTDRYLPMSNRPIYAESVQISLYKLCPGSPFSLSSFSDTRTRIVVRIFGESPTESYCRFANQTQTVASFREKTSWKLSRAFIDREDGSFFLSFLLSSSFFVRNEFQARRVSTNYLTEVTRYESSLKWIVLFVPLPMLMIRDSSLFPLLLNCPLDSFDNFFVAYVYNEESWIAKCIHVYYMYSWEYFCFCIGRRYYSDSRTLK